MLIKHSFNLILNLFFLLFLIKFKVFSELCNDLDNHNYLLKDNLNRTYMVNGQDIQLNVKYVANCYLEINVYIFVQYRALQIIRIVQFEGKT